MKKINAENVLVQLNSEISLRVNHEPTACNDRKEDTVCGLEWGCPRMLKSFSLSDVNGVIMLVMGVRGASGILVCVRLSLFQNELSIIKLKSK